MNISEYLISSLDALRTNKLRSGLSLIGIIVGVASVVVLVGLGNGMKEKLIKSFSATNNIITIASGPDYGMLMGPSSGKMSENKGDPYEVVIGRKFLLSEGMAERIRKTNFPNIKAVVPVFNTVNATTSLNGKTIYPSLMPLSDAYFQARNLRIQDGILFSEKMLKDEEKVAVVGFSTVSNTFENQNPLGKTLAINGQSFTIIGVFGKTGDYNVDQSIFIPLTIAKRLFGLKDVARIEVVVKDLTKMKDTQGFISEFLNRYFGDFSSQIYHLETNERILQEMNKSINSMTLFIAGIAAISLLVGGIGIMNVMLVSVTELTREIGIRKAIGATWVDILTQFLIESGTITGIGGIIAILLSYAIGFGIEKFVPTMAFAISISIIFIATGFSILMGVIFGILPAWKAARMKVIDALRFE